LSLADIDQLEQSVRVRKSHTGGTLRCPSLESTEKSWKNERAAQCAGYTVFYDFDQQHQLWGQNLRLKLQDVYANEAQYMVIFLSKEYPEKDWPFLSLKSEKGQRPSGLPNTLLPIVVDDVSVVGLSKDVGYLDLRRMSVREIAGRADQENREHQTADGYAAHLPRAFSASAISSTASFPTPWRWPLPHRRLAHASLFRAVRIGPVDSCQLGEFVQRKPLLLPVLLHDLGEGGRHVTIHFSHSALVRSHGAGCTLDYSLDPLGKTL